jgi:hypothetical protein
VHLGVGVVHVGPVVLLAAARGRVAVHAVGVAAVHAGGVACVGVLGAVAVLGQLPRRGLVAISLGVGAATFAVGGPAAGRVGVPVRVRVVGVIRVLGAGSRQPAGGRWPGGR